MNSKNRKRYPCIGIPWLNSWLWPMAITGRMVEISWMAIGLSPCWINSRHWYSTVWMIRRVSHYRFQVMVCIVHLGFSSLCIICFFCILYFCINKVKPEPKKKKVSIWQVNKTVRRWSFKNMEEKNLVATWRWLATLCLVKPSTFISSSIFEGIAWSMPICSIAWTNFPCNSEVQST